jgi:hypothetical protein
MLMSGSRSYSTSDASEKPERDEAVLSLKTVQKMLPLVQRIVTDILAQQHALLRLQPEEEHLDRKKRLLDWPQRQRRYQIKEELAGADLALQAALAELHELGVALLDEGAGLIGFPTLVNNRRAYFSWRPGETSLQNWQFTNEDVQRPIPPSWFKELSMSNKS